MGWIGKEEYVDYTLLKKKGLLKIKEQEAQKNLKTEGGFVDFTSLANAENPANTTETGANNFGFLADMASAASNPSSANPLANFDTVSSASNSVSSIPENIDAKELNALKLKIDDMEYKLNKFIERIDKLEEKLVKQGNF